MMQLMRKLHKYIGLGAAIVIIATSLTGILLVHRKSLNLDKISVRAPGYSASQAPDAWDMLVLKGGDHLVATKQGLFLRSGTVWTRPLPQQVKKLLQSQNVIYAGGKQGLFASHDRGRTWKGLLAGTEVKAIRVEGRNIYVATAKTLLSARRGEPTRWEQALSFEPLTLDVRDVLVSEKGFLVIAKEGVFRAEGGGPLRAEPLPLPARGAEAVELQKLITDIHTGDFFGSFFYIFVDASAVGLVVLTLTGVYLWYVPRKRRRAAGAQTQQQQSAGL